MTKDELLFNAWLTSLNQRLGRYVVRLMDESTPTSTTEYTVPLAEVEAALGHDLRELADAILTRSIGLALPCKTPATGHAARPSCQLPARPRQPTAAHDLRRRKEE